MKGASLLPNPSKKTKVFTQSPRTRTRSEDVFTKRAIATGASHAGTKGKTFTWKLACTTQKRPNHHCYDGQRIHTRFRNCRTRPEPPATKHPCRPHDKEVQLPPPPPRNLPESQSCSRSSEVTAPTHSDKLVTGAIRNRVCIDRESGEYVR